MAEDTIEEKNDKPIHYNVKDTDLIPQDIVKLSQTFINMLQELFDKEINTPDATVLRFKNYIPMFTVFGTLLAAQLDIKQEEYYAIVDYYIQDLNLLAKQGGVKNEVQE